MDTEPNVDRDADVVVAVTERTQLPLLLTNLHRGGYGHVVRVLDPERGDVAGQLRRAGVEPPLGLAAAGQDGVVLMIAAAARTAAAAGLLRRLGVRSIWTTVRAGAAPQFPDFTRPARARQQPAEGQTAD
jgi:hypothetical protein